VNRCPAGQAAIEAMDEGPIPDDTEARRLGGLLLAGEARVGRLRERLKAYLQDREPLTLEGLEFGFFPTKGRYDSGAVFRAVTDAGVDPWSLLTADGRTLAAFLKGRPDVERVLAAAWTPSPPWFGHRKVKTADSNGPELNRLASRSVAMPPSERAPGPDDGSP
jgi:hypothetical protein